MKRKRNPIDHVLMYKMLIPIIHLNRNSWTTRKNFSRIFAYKSSNDEGKCEDCDQEWINCTCEGSREIPWRPCEDCGYNYCICDYNLDKLEELDLITEIANLAKLWFNNNQMNQFIKMINLEIQDYDDNHIKTNLSKLLGLLEIRKSNPRKRRKKKK